MCSRNHGPFSRRHNSAPEDSSNTLNSCTLLVVISCITAILQYIVYTALCNLLFFLFFPLAQNAEGWDYQADLSKHESQTDASKGFGGKYGVQKDRLDEVSTLIYNNFYEYLIIIAVQSAVGWDHQEKLAQHSSQSDSSKGFGGKYGVQKEQQDKVHHTVA